jgi:hypothetical protein
VEAGSLEAAGQLPWFTTGGPLGPAGKAGKSGTDKAGSEKKGCPAGEGGGPGRKDGMARSMRAGSGAKKSGWKQTQCFFNNYDGLDLKFLERRMFIQ